MNDRGLGAPAAEVLVPLVGDKVGEVPVKIGPNFLQLFSAQMYSSPNKAFEELVSNSWDAEARVVYVQVPSNLNVPEAAVWVLDDGESMDIDGLEQLWAIADSKKRDSPPKNRAPIGKFGIGKLSTYILARQLTHVCRSSDGKIRAITMDYGVIEQGPPKALQGTSVDLEVRELSTDDLATLLKTFAGGDRMLRLIDAGIPVPAGADGTDEFGGPPVAPPRPAGTWTLAIMSALKPAGRQMQSGVVRRMLRFALPLKSSIAIVYNEEPLESTKVEVAEQQKWVLGVNPLVDEVTVGDPNGTGTNHKITSTTDKYPHVTLEGFPGAISGTVTLFAERISGAKSDEEIGTSHGFSVNVKGRVINLRDPYFGLSNLSHSAWSKFRAAIRADGLDESLLSHRETVANAPSLAIFRAFLLSIFNKVRTHHDLLMRESVLDVGKILVQGWSSVPLETLHRAVAEGLQGSAADLPPFIDASEIDSFVGARADWEADAEARPHEMLRGVTLESRDIDAPLVQYRLSKRDIVVNANHPFTREHAETPDQQLLLRNSAVVDVLTEAFMTSELSLPTAAVREIRDYRDRLLRLIAMVTRRTGAQVAELLMRATGHAKGLELIVGDALEHLGFVVDPMGRSGEPEGVALAPLTPDEKDSVRSYSFTYDAKSAKDGRVAAKDMNVGGLLRHRDDHKARYILVVGPDYAEGAIGKECARHDITPMRARDLARLLLIVSATGPIDLDEFRTLFERHTPDAVSVWVTEYEGRAVAKPRLSINLFFSALKKIGFNGPNAIEASVVALEISRLPEANGYHPRRADVLTVAQGLQVFVPNLINVLKNDIYLSTSPEKIRDAMASQLAKFPEDYLGAWSATSGIRRPSAVGVSSRRRRKKGRRK